MEKIHLLASSEIQRQNSIANKTKNACEEKLAELQNRLEDVRHNNTTQLYNINKCDNKQCDTIQHNTIQYNTIQYNTIQYNTIQYNTRGTWWRIVGHGGALLDMVAHWLRRLLS